MAALQAEEGLQEWLDSPQGDQLAAFRSEPVLRAAVEELVRAGVPVPAAVAENLGNGAHAVLIAEAINLAAKAIDEDFYELKAGVFCAAAMTPGVECGWGEGGCFYLSAAGVGEVCCHDPYGQTEQLAVALELTSDWPRRWSGIRRQALAFLALSRPCFRRLLDEATSLGRWSDEQVNRIGRRFGALV